MCYVVILLLLDLVFSQDFLWGTVFKGGHLNLSTGVVGPLNSSYVIARWQSDTGIVFGLGQVDLYGKALGRFAWNSTETTPSSFQILLNNDLYLYTWVLVTDYLITPGLEALSNDKGGLLLCTVMSNGEISLGQWNYPDSASFPFNGTTLIIQGVECEAGWVLVSHRIGSVSIEILDLDPSAAVTTTEDVEVISGNFFNQASNLQSWKWDVNYNIISANSFTVSTTLPKVPITFNIKVLRQSWAQMSTQITQNPLFPNNPQSNNPPKVTSTPRSTSTPRPHTYPNNNTGTNHNNYPNNTHNNNSSSSSSFPTTSPTISPSPSPTLPANLSYIISNYLPSLPLKDFITVSTLTSNGPYQLITSVNRTFTSTFEVTPYTLVTAEATITLIRIGLPYLANKKIYDENGKLLAVKSISGNFTSLSSSLTRISLSEPNTPCGAGFYGYGTCNQCPPGTTSPPRARTILSCRCDISNGYAGTISCIGCGADTYATAEGCMACPPGCNSPPFSSVCNCQAALNIATSNNMLSSTVTPTYPGFTTQEKNAVFAILLLFTITIIFLISFVFVLFQKQKRMSTEISDRQESHRRYSEDEQRQRRNLHTTSTIIRNKTNSHYNHNNSSHMNNNDPHVFSPSNSFLSSSTLVGLDDDPTHSHILTSNLFQNNTLQV